MANLIKIANVAFYAGFDNIDVFACKKILDDNFIPYQFLVYSDSSSYPSLFAALGTWSFGPNFTQYNFTQMPIIVWTEYYDDYERFACISLNSTDLATSNLVAHANLIVGYTGSGVAGEQAIVEGYIDTGFGNGNYNGQLGSILTVTSVSSGAIVEGMGLTGSGLSGNFSVATFGQSGTTGTGGIGTYYIVGRPVAAAPTTLTGTLLA